RLPGKHNRINISQVPKQCIQSLCTRTYRKPASIDLPLEVILHDDGYFAIFLRAYKNHSFRRVLVQALIGHRGRFSGAWINLPPRQTQFLAALYSLLGDHHQETVRQRFSKTCLRILGEVLRKPLGSTPKYSRRNSFRKGLIEKRAGAESWCHSFRALLRGNVFSQDSFERSVDDPMKHAGRECGGRVVLSDGPSMIPA